MTKAKHNIVCMVSSCINSILVLLFQVGAIVGSLYLRNVLSFDVLILVSFISSVLLYLKLENMVTRENIPKLKHFVMFALIYFAQYQVAYQANRLLINHYVFDMSENTYRIFLHISMVLDVLMVFVEDFLIINTIRFIYRAIKQSKYRELIIEENKQYYGYCSIELCPETNAEIIQFVKENKGLCYFRNENNEYGGIIFRKDTTNKLYEYMYDISKKAKKKNIYLLEDICYPYYVEYYNEQ